MFSRAKNAAHAAERVDEIFRSMVNGYAPEVNGFIRPPGWYKSLGECVHDLIITISLLSNNITINDYLHNVPNRFSPRVYLGMRGVSSGFLDLAAAFVGVKDIPSLARVYAERFASIWPILPNIIIGVHREIISGVCIGTACESSTVIRAQRFNDGIYFTATPPGLECTRTVLFMYYSTVKIHAVSAVYEGRPWWPIFDKAIQAAQSS